MNKQIQPKQFKYNTDLVSSQSFSEHLKLYNNYVNKTNTISTQQKDYINETYNLDGIILHELFFENITNSNHHIPQSIQDFFTKHFGNFQNWKDDFITCAKASRGWCIFGYDSVSDSFRNISLESHNIGVVVGFEPVIVLDMYEHAFYIDYYTDKVKYIEKFMECINWNIIEDRIKEFETINIQQSISTDKPILVFDQDDTLMPFIPSILERYNQKYNDNIKIEQITQYDFSHLLKSNCIDIFDEFVDESLFLNTKPFDGIFEAIEKLESKYQILFCTAGYPNTFGWREEWFKKWYRNFNPEQLSRLVPKELFSGNIFGMVDDKIENLMGNYKGFLIDNNWNYCSNRLLRRNGIIRINSVCELPEILL